jgi:hypothetical protein
LLEGLKAVYSEIARGRVQHLVDRCGQVPAFPLALAASYAKLRLTLTYQPEEKLVQATIKPGLNMRKGFVSEGGLELENW